MSWNEIETDPSFQALPAERKARIKTNYFDKEIAPKVPSNELDDVKSSFFQGQRFNDNDKATNDGIASIGGIIHRAIQSGAPEFKVLGDRLIAGTRAGTKMGLESAKSIAGMVLNPAAEVMPELQKIPIPGAETLNTAIKETAGGVASEVSRSLARQGHPDLAVPAGVATSMLSGPGLAYLANPEARTAADVVNMIAAGKFFDVLGKIPSPEIPPLRYIYNNIKYKMGLPTETGLVASGENALRQAVKEGRVSLADAMRSNPTIFKEELNKRGLTPDQLKERPPITPEETANAVMKSEELHPGAAKSAQLAPRTFMAATSVSETPATATTRLGAFQGQINEILRLKPGTPVTPETYHRAMETGKLNRIEALELDESIFKAEASKEGIPSEAQGTLYQHSQIAGQKPVEFKVMKDLAETVKNEANPQSVSASPGKTPEFHEMTKEAFQAEAAQISQGSVSPDLASQVHQDIIEQAIGEGNEVPGQVIASHAPDEGIAVSGPQSQPSSPAISGQPTPSLEGSPAQTPGSQGQEISSPSAQPQSQEIGPSRWSIADNGLVRNMPMSERVRELLKDEARAYGVPEDHPDLPQWISNRAYKNKEATFATIRELSNRGKDITDDQMERYLNSIMRDNDRMDTIRGTGLVQPQTNIETDVMGKPIPPWTPESQGWEVKDISRPGVVAERDNDIVVKTASGKFKAYKEDTLIGEFSTTEEAAKAIDNIDNEEAQLQQASERELRRAVPITPAMDLARKYGISKSSLEKGNYGGEAENLKGRGIVKNTGGMSPDELAEKMFEAKIIPEHDLNLMWDVLDKEARLGPKSQITPTSGMSGTSSLASKGGFAEGTPQEPAQLATPIKRAMPLEMPELVRLSRELLGRYPDISNRMGKQTRGLFTTSGGVPQIRLRPELFQDADQVAKTLAHEIGHANDYFPEETLSRGNLIGRIMSFNKYLKDTYGELNEDNLPAMKYTAKELKKELIALSEYWRPYDRSSAETSFIKYRESGKELYADALSVFLNSPGTLQKLAPKFFQSLMDNLDSKPEFKEEWLNIQDLLNGAREDTLKARREDIRQMGMKSEEILIKKQLEKQQELQSVGEKLAQGILDRFFPILKAANEYEAKGNKIPDRYNPKYVLQEGDMVGNDKAMMDLNLDAVLNPLREKYGLGPIELHEYGFNNRILHDRSGLANPLGMDVKAAQENLDYLKKELGNEAFNALKTAFDATQDIFWPVVEEAHDLGVIADDLFKDTILPNKGNYVSFAVLDYLEKTGYISAGISQQTGTLREVANTWLSTRMKTAAMMARNLDQKSKLSFKYVWDQRFPGELKKTQVARMGAGPGIEKPEPGKEVLHMYENGKRVGYDVDPYIAQAFEKWKPAQMNLIIKTLNLTSYPFKMMYTMENAGFVFFTSPIRYFQKTYKGLSGTQGEGIIPLLANYITSLPTSFSKAIGKPNEFAQELIKQKVLDVSMADLELAPELNSYYQKAKKYELAQQGPSDNGLMKRVGQKLLYPILKISHGMQIAADTSTSAWKIAAAKIRLKAGESGPEMAYNVRNYAGIPNPRVKGLYAKQANALFLFANILQRHLSTAYQVMTMPKTKGGAALKTAALDVVPAIYQALAALGVLGYSLKEFYERYSKYDRRHYTIIPLGSVKGGEYGWKSMGLPIPHDDAGRIIHGMTTELVTALYNKKPREFQAMLGELWSTLPGITPSIEIPRVWVQEYTGGKAWDAFRQRTVIPDRVEKIGGMLKLEKMLEWTINETGLTNFSSYDPAKRSTTEVMIQSTPLINRMIKISDYGKTEKFREEMEDFPMAEEAYRLQQQKKQGPLSREDALRLQVLRFQAKQHRAQVKQEQAKEKVAP